MKGSSTRHFDHRSGHRLQVEGSEIYFEIQGDASEPALLLLHGGFGNIEDFNVMIARLRRPYRLIGIDSRGHGASTLGDRPLRYERLQADAEAVSDHLGLGSFAMIGFSDGGIAALRMAARPGARVSALVTIGAHWELASDDPTREVYQSITADLWRQTFPETAAAYESLNPAPDFDRLTEAVKELWLDDSARGYPNDDVRRIKSRLLVVRGDDDQLVSRRNAFDLAERVEGSRLLSVPFAGHAVHEDRADLMMQSVNEFLEE